MNNETRPPDPTDEWRDGGWYTDRNYALFALLADVRNRTGTDPIVAPRGLPDDVSPTVAATSEFFDSDGHSHSWLTLDEVYAHRQELAETRPGGRWGEAMEAIKSHPAPTRIVFWFDN